MQNLKRSMDETAGYIYSACAEPRSEFIARRRRELCRTEPKKPQLRRACLIELSLAFSPYEPLAKACQLGLEGVVSKRAGSFYKSGPSRNWLKTKNPDFVGM